MAKIKVGILCNIVVPYTIPVFNLLSQLQDIDLEVLYIAKSAPNRIWDPAKFEPQMKYKFTYLSGVKLSFKLKKEPVQYVLDPFFLSALRKRKFDVVITYGWFDFACQMTAIFHKRLGYKHIVWSDSTLYESSLGRLLTGWFVKWFVRQADGCIASGISAKKYFLHLGVNEKKIVIVPNTIDTGLFLKQVSESRKRASQIRTNLKIPFGHKIVLYVGQFIHRKGVDILLKAFKKLGRPEVWLLVVGYGEERGEYENLIHKHHIKNVQIISGDTKNMITDYYCLADCFVLPSREETWGLVVNEAMSAGVPVIVSDKVGSGRDLVIEGKTGYVFPSENVDRLSVILDKCLGNLERGGGREEFEKVLARFKPDNVAKQMSKAIYSVL